MDNSNVQTLSDYIRYGKTSSFEIPSISFLEKEGSVVYLDEVAYSKYDQLLIDNSIVIDLTTKEYNLYRLDPKKLSFDLYGTPNLYHIILYLNNTSEFEFDTKRVRLLNHSFINSTFKSIISHEEENINKSILNCKG